MVDFTTQTRHYGYRYNSPEKREPVFSTRDLYRESSSRVFQTTRAQPHDCREAVVQDATDRGDWEAYMFSEGLQKTCDVSAGLHSKGRADPDDEGKKTPDKLLYTVGTKGQGSEEFLYPRSLVTVPSSGEILIADSANHRVSRYNQCGVYVGCFGEKGAEPGQFREPTGVALLSDESIVVADHRNKRIQVLTPSGEPKYEFSTVDKPYFVCCDAVNNIVVSTSAGTVEVYRRPATLWYRFPLPGRRGNPSAAACITVNNKDEVLVSDASQGTIQYYTYSGRLLHRFQPQSGGDSLACQPAGLAVDTMGQVIVVDILNHVVNLYSERGSLLAQLVGPTDGAGAAQDVALGPEGHLVVIEYTSNGTHCLKIFRYQDCECHKPRSAFDRKPKEQL